METCVWTFDDYHCFWETSCDGAWCFDSSLEYGCVKYCPGCGKPIQEVREPEVEEDDT